MYREAHMYMHIQYICEYIEHNSRAGHNSTMDTAPLKPIAHPK